MKIRLIRILFCCALVCALCLSCALAAEEYIDCSGDFSAYARTVAMLNRRCAFSARGSEAMQAVLVRAEALNADEIDALCAAEGPDGCWTLYFADAAEAEAAVEALEKLDGVIYAELDGDVSLAEGEISPTIEPTPEPSSEPSIEPTPEPSSEPTPTPAPTSAAGSEPNSWGAARMGFPAYASYVQLYGGGSATVAVIDTGSSRHSFYADRILRSGYDYVDADADATSDAHGHGTAVAGIIADCSRGLPVYIYPIRALDASGNGKMSNLVLAVREAVRAGVDAINLSIESKVMSTALDDAILDANRAGITVIVAAGNSACDTSQRCPAHLTERGVIVVASADQDGSLFTRSSYSNYGASVDVYAFGSNVLCCALDGGYVKKSGTSFAAPHISALSCMLRLLHPALTPEEIETHIKSAASGSVNVPLLSGMIPRERGFSLEKVHLSVGESLPLPEHALPASAQEKISYSSASPEIVALENGVLVALAEGSSQIVAACTGFEDVSFEVIVEAEGETSLSLPEGLVSLEDGAFEGSLFRRIDLPEGLTSLGAGVFEGCDGLRLVVLPESLSLIGENSFSGAVLLCAGEAQMSWAKANALPYVLLQ